MLILDISILLDHVPSHVASDIQIAILVAKLVENFRTITALFEHEIVIAVLLNGIGEKENSGTVLADDPSVVSGVPKAAVLFDFTETNVAYKLKEEHQHHIQGKPPPGTLRSHGRWTVWLIMGKLSICGHLAPEGPIACVRRDRQVFRIIGRRKPHRPTPSLFMLAVMRGMRPRRRTGKDHRSGRG
jgi:hypothetical protein